MKDEAARISDGVRKMSTSCRKNQEQYSKGFEDGKNFKPSRSIKEG